MHLVGDSPFERGVHSRWWCRTALGEHRRETTEESLRPVVGHRNQAATLGDPEELARNPLRVRREHRAEDRRHDIEPLVRKWELLGIGLAPLDGKAQSAGPRAAELHHRRRQIGGHNGRPEAGSSDGEVPVAGCDIEDLRARLEAAPLGQLDGMGLEVTCDRAVVSERPHPPDPVLHVRVVRHEKPPMRRHPAAPA